MEKKLLGLSIGSRDVWETLCDLIEPSELSIEAQRILDLVREYYERDPDASQVDRDVLCAQIERTTLSPKAAQILQQTIRNLDISQDGKINVLEEIRQHKLHVIGTKLGSALIEGHSPSVEEYLEAYVTLRDTSQVPGGADKGDDEVHSGVSLRDLTARSFSKEGLIEVWPPSLNAQLDGGARPGHHILVFAPTEMGKTLVAINMVAGFLRQRKKVLYVGNEDPAADILMRLASRLSGRNKYEIIQDPEGTDELLSRRNWDLFTLVSLAPGTFGRINALARRLRPDVIVLDQLRNIDVKSDNRVVGLERAATEARNLAKRAGVLVVSITQAGDSASGKRVLGRGDVDFSNVGIPGQCDLMIGVGADEQMEKQNVRVLSFPKNKLSGKHEPITVGIDPALSKVIDYDT